MRLLPVGCLLLVAWSNLSASGAAFLALFLLWAHSLSCSRIALLSHHARTWTLAALLSALLFVAILVVQLLQSLSLLRCTPMLAALGLSACGASLPQLALLLGGPLLLVLTSVAEGQECRAEADALSSASDLLQAGGGRDSDGAAPEGDEGTERLPATSAPSRSQLPLLTGAAGLEGASHVSQQQAAHISSRVGHQRTWSSSSFGFMGAGGPDAWGAASGSDTNLLGLAPASGTEAAAQTTTARTASASSVSGTWQQAGYTSTGVLVAGLVGGCGLLWPSLASLPYVLVVVWGVQRWSCARPIAVNITTLSVLQLYCAAHLLLLYATQVPALCTVPLVQSVSGVLGLYRLTLAALPSDLVPQLLHLLALHALFPALAAYRPVQRALQQLSAPGGTPHAVAVSGSGGLLLGLASWVMRGLEGWCGPVAAALALCVVAMLEVSVAGGGLLALGIWTLLAPKRVGKQMLASIARPLATTMLVWLLAIYVATSTRDYWHGFVPQLLQSLGLFMFTAPPAVCLAMSGQLLAAVLVAGLAHKTSSREADASASRGGRTSSRVGAAWDPELGQLSSSGQASLTTPLLSDVQYAAAAVLPVSYAEAGAGSSSGRAGAHGAPGTDATGTGVAVAARASDELSDAALTAVVCSWYTGFAAAPFTWLLVAVVRTDILHVVYAVYAAASYAASTLQLAPGTGRQGTAPPRHALIRVYASLHLLALYAAMCGSLPGLEVLQRPELEPLFRLIGFWDPSLTRDCLPVLLVLVVATVHAGAGSVLQHRNVPPLGSAAAAGTLSHLGHAQPGSSSDSTLTGRPAPGGNGLPLLGSIAQGLGSLATSAGPLVLCGVAFALVVVRASHVPGVLDVAYIGLLSAVLLLPPRLGPYLSHLTPRILRGSSTLQLVLGHGGVDGLRWGITATLAALAQLDLLLQMGVSLLTASYPEALSEEIKQTLADVLGVDVGESRSELLEDLLRPALLLAVLQAYRWCFAMGACIAKQHEGAALSHVGGRTQERTGGVGAATTAAPAVATALTVQRGWGWLLKRSLILHVDKLLAVGAFGVLLQEPGALGLSLLAGLCVALPWLSGSQLPLAASAWQGAGMPVQAAPLRARAMLVGLQVLMMGWVLVESAAQVPWVRQVVLCSGDNPASAQPGDVCNPTDLARLLQWAGMPFLSDQAMPADIFQAVTGLKCALLCAAYLRVKAWRWVTLLPPEVAAAAQRGRPCALFWPPASRAWAGPKLPGCAWLARPSASRTAPPGVGSGTVGVDTASGAGEDGAGGAAHDTAQAEAQAVADQEELVEALLGPTSPLTDAANLVAQPVAALVSRIVDVIQGGATQVMRAMDLPAGSSPRGSTELPGHLQGFEAGAGERRAEGEEAGAGLAASQAAVTRQGPGDAASTPQSVTGHAVEAGASGSESDTESGAESIADFAHTCASGSEGAWEEVEATPSSEPGGAVEAVEEEVGSASVPAAPQGTAEEGKGGSTSRASSRPDAARPTATTAVPLPQTASVMDLAPAHRTSPVPPPAATSPPMSALPMSGPGSSRHVPHAHGGWRRLAVALVALRTVVEEVWATWGVDIACLSLLLAAFVAASALSLAYFAIAVAAARLSVRGRLRLWRAAAIPFLTLSLLFEYGVWVGPEELVPPPLLSSAYLPAPVLDMRPQGVRPHLVLGLQHHTLLRWLGLVGVRAQTLWALFLALAAVVTQAQSDWAKAAVPAAGAAAGGEARDDHERGATRTLRARPPTAGSQPQRSGDNKGGSSVGQGSGDLGSPLLGSRSTGDAEEGNVGAGARPGAVGVVHGTSPTPPPPPLPAQPGAKPGLGAASNTARPHSLSLFAPLDLWQQHTWGVHDWARYLAVKHSLDVLLVSVVVLCAAQRDLVHAGYLALVLLLFRKRSALQSGGAHGTPVDSPAFKLLPRFNVVVLAAELMYQAPLHLMLGNHWDNPCTGLAGLHASHTTLTSALMQHLTTPSFSGNSVASSDGGWGAARPPPPPPPSPPGGGGSTPSCTLPQLLGLCKLQGTEGGHAGGGPLPGDASALSPLAALLASPVVADILLWVLLRLHAKLCTSRLYQQVRAVVVAQHTVVSAEIAQLRQEDAERQAHEALAASQHRAARNRRIARLKAVFVQAAPGSGGAALFESLPTAAGLADLLDDGKGAGLELPTGMAATAATTRQLPYAGGSPAAPPATHSATGVSTQQQPAAVTGSRMPALRRIHSMAQARTSQAPQTPSTGVASTELVAGVGWRDPSGQIGEDEAALLLETAGTLGSGDASLGDDPAAGEGSGGASGEALALLQRRARRRAYVVRQGPAWLTWLRRRQIRKDDESWIAYGALLMFFVVDASLLAAGPALCMLLAVLLFPGKPRGVWQAALVYTELLLVLQYSYLSLVRCVCTGPSHSFFSPSSTPLSAPANTGGTVGVCSWWLASPSIQRAVRVLGLHDAATSCLPMFLAYLSVLMHSYHLARIHSRHVAISGAAANREAGTNTLGGVIQGAAASGTATPATGISRHSSLTPGALPPPTLATASTSLLPSARRGPSSMAAAQQWVLAALARVSPRALGQRVVRSVRAVAWHVTVGAYQLVQVYKTVGQRHELGKHWVRVDVAWSSRSLADAACGTPEGRAALERSFNLAVASLMRVDGRAARARAQAAHTLCTAAAHARAQQGRAAAEELLTATTHWGAGAAPHPPSTAHVQVGGNSQEGAHGGRDGLTAGSAAPTPPEQDLSRTTPLLLRLEHAVVGVGTTATPSAAAAPPTSSSDAPGTTQGAPSAQRGQSRPLPTASLTLAPGSTGLSSGGTIVTTSLMFEVKAPPGGPPPEFESTLTFQLARWRPRSMRPAADAALALTRLGREQAGPRPPSASAASAAATAPRASGTTSRAPAAAGTAAGATQLFLAATSTAAGTSSTSGSPGVNPASAPLPTTVPAGATASGAATGTTAATAPGPATAVVLPSDVLPCRVLGAEGHSRQGRDLYAATLALDLLSFLYATLFYQSVLTARPGTAAGAFADLGDTSRTLPLPYIAALMALFGLMVAERTVYIMGAHAAKLALHLGSISLLVPWCLALVWRGAAGPGAHVRVFLTLRCVGWVLGALQLRSGYPPLSSPTGGQRGRNAFFFYRSTGRAHYLGYQVFCAVPFLYELRTLLDWTCTATTLDWYSWLKLEDIRGSLYAAAARRRAQAGRAPGERVPRYEKFLQGALLLSLLLLVLWLPPLVFSTGAPTYTTPAVLGLGLNVSLAQVTAPGVTPGGAQAVTSFPLYSGGSAYMAQDWGVAADGGGAGQYTLPPALAAYGAQQVKLMCLPQDSESVWVLSPPARAALLASLNTSLTPRGPDDPDDAPQPTPTLVFSWWLMRSAPLANGRGAGPGCAASARVPLSGMARAELLRVLQHGGHADLSSLNSSDVDGGTAGHGGAPGLFPLAWRVRGETCLFRPWVDDVGSAAGGASDESGDPEPDLSHSWALEGVSCSIGLQGLAAASEQHDSGGLSKGAGGGGVIAGGALWWVLNCTALRSMSGAGGALNASHQAVCPRGSQGPALLVILERVQAGILGATLASFGIAGLYLTFVYGIARLMRLSMSNLRLKIPSEDLPSTRRLVTLCQDIYIARAQGELVLEQELFASLINIYRSPAVLFELTRARGAPHLQPLR